MASVGVLHLVCQSKLGSEGRVLHFMCQSAPHSITLSLEDARKRFALERRKVFAVKNVGNNTPCKARCDGEQFDEPCTSI